MKKFGYLILGLLIAVLAFVGIAYFTKKKDDGKKDNEGVGRETTGQAAPPVDPAPTTVNNEKPVLDPATPEGKKMIENRLNLVYSSNDYNNLTDQVDFRTFLLARTKYPNAWKQYFSLMAYNWQGLNVPPSSINAGKRFVSKCKEAIEFPSFEEYHKNKDFQASLQSLDDSLDFTTVSNFRLMDGANGNMKKLIESGDFFKSGQADKNQSERWDSMQADAKIICENLVALSEKLNSMAVNDALTAFARAGYNVIGL